MAERNAASKAKFVFSVAGLTTELRVVSFEVIEAVSEPYEMNVTVASDRPLTFAEVKERTGTLTIYAGDGTVARTFQGIVNKLKLAGDGRGMSISRLRLVPALWFLSMPQDCRIFQDMKLTDLLTAVLTAGGVLQNSFRFLLDDPERKVNFSVQYGETDFNYVARLLEAEGIFYFFTEREGKTELVFADSSFRCPEMAPVEAAEVTGWGDDGDESAVAAFNVSQRVVPEEYSVASYDFKHASVTPAAKRGKGGGTRRAIFDFAGTFASEEKGKQVATTRLQEQQLFMETGKGMSVCPRLKAGIRFSLTDRRGTLSGPEYIALAVEHAGEQLQVLEENASGGTWYRNSFICVPSKQEIRPPRITAKPVIPGLHSATVVAGGTEDSVVVDPEGYLRVRVLFPWDHRGKEKSGGSCWIRVVQPWGGGGWGMQFVPRPGEEVMVAFLEGDPDRPVIVGSVYNSINRPIFPLPDMKTKSGIKTKSSAGAGYNELSFEDRQGGEKVFLRAEKDYGIEVLNNRSESVKGIASTEAETITITARSKIRIDCCGSLIELDASGVRVNGKQIRLN